MAAYIRLDWRRPGVEPEELLRAGEAAIPVFEAARDDLGLAKAWGAVADYYYSREQSARSQEAFERSLFHARRSGDAEHEAIALARLSGGFRFGPNSVDEAIARMERELDDPEVAPHPRAVWTAFLGVLEARRGNVERARDLCLAARKLIEEVGDVVASFWITDASIEVCLLAGDLVAAERLAHENVELTGPMGDVWPDSGWLELARVLLDQGRSEEAETTLDRIEDQDYAYVKLVRAQVLARRKDLDQAEHLARATVDFYDQTDAEPMQAEAHRVLGDVLGRLGRRDEAREALEHALELEERRGATLLAERTRALLAELA
jgi:tetratricopeptide (TPR) repeat protein